MDRQNKIIIFVLVVITTIMFFLPEIKDWAHKSSLDKWRSAFMEYEILKKQNKDLAPPAGIYLKSHSYSEVVSWCKGKEVCDVLAVDDNGRMYNFPFENLVGYSTKGK